MIRRALLAVTVLATVSTPVLAKKTAEEIMEDFRELLEKQSYKKCTSKASLKKIRGFCACYSIRASDAFNNTDLLYFAKKKNFSPDYKARRKRIALECLRETKNN